MKNYLVIDIGTGNSRVAIAGADGTIYGMKHTENQYFRDEAYPDAQYFKPQDWERKFFQMAKELLGEFPDIHIDAITASGCRQSTVFLGKDGNAVYGIPNMDHRGKEYLKEISKKQMIYEKTGRWVSTFPAGNLYGLKRRRGELYEKIDKFTSLSEWVGFMLTGNLVMEFSLACETQLLDIGKKCWSDEIFEIYGLSKRLTPELLAGPGTLGNITEEGKKRLGLPYDVPFIVSGADTQNAVIGAGGEVGDVTVISGTTSPLFFSVKEKYYDRQERCWVDLNIGGENYFIETNPGVTGLNFQRIKNLMFSDVSYEDLDRKLMAMEHAKMTASFTTLLFDTGEHIKRGGFLTGAPWNQEIGRYDFMAAAAADIACALYRNYNKLTELAAHKKDYIRGCGGGFQSEFLCQTLSDLTGKDLILPKGFSQASLLGCVKLMNRFMEEDQWESGGLGEFQVYHPSGRGFVCEYYEKWEEFQRLVCS